MTARSALLAAVTLFAALSACDRSDPPSDRIERAAEQLVSDAEGETLPARPTGPFAPRDECRDQPGGGAFLASLLDAVATREADDLLALSSEDIRLDFGGGNGAAELRDRLAADDGALWDELAEIVAMGCASDGATMTMPWYFAQGLPVDPYGGMIVTGEEVPLLDEPSADAPVLASLSWEAVELTGSPETDVAGGFTRVSWAQGAAGQTLVGFVESDRLRPYIDYRLIASRRNGSWHLTAFIAGD
ncbi:hypothetical protein [Aurantiacibacter gilvus]|uniref:Uncharacterized protein n=1 Tax=Aurantiacibacter gilvus TaxID=3139141 RepID=A0ABU9IBJ9_9SPHN